MQKSNLINDVMKFWEENPLFTGESKSETGSKEWFEEWEEVYINDCFAGKNPEDIYTGGLTAESKILDVGCGPGFWVRYFLKHDFFNVSACDLTSQAVSLTRKSLELYSLDNSIDILTGNAEDLPYDAETFDHVNCQGVIHHTPNTQKCIEEFYRVLKPGGTVCFSVYYKVFLLRHPQLLKISSRLLSPFVHLSGRGRESTLSSGDAEEIVRMYDGIDNPIGKAFTLNDLEMMLDGRFKIKQTRRTYFPARALPVKIPKWLHRRLHDRHGLMIVIQAVKK